MNKKLIKQLTNGYDWIIFVEENNNQYIPRELIGIVVSETSLSSFLKLL